MAENEISETLLANYGISVERIKQAFEFLANDNEQFVIFNSDYIIKVERLNYDLRLQITNREIEKSYIRIIAGSEIDSTKHDLVTAVVHWMIGEIESRVMV